MPQAEACQFDDQQTQVITVGSEPWGRVCESRRADGKLASGRLVSPENLNYEHKEGLGTVPAKQTNAKMHKDPNRPSRGTDDSEPHKTPLLVSSAAGSNRNLLELYPKVPSMTLKLYLLCWVWEGNARQNPREPVTHLHQQPTDLPGRQSVPAKRVVHR